MTAHSGREVAKGCEHPGSPRLIARAAIPSHGGVEVVGQDDFVGRASSERPADRVHLCDEGGSGGLVDPPSLHHAEAHEQRRTTA